MPRSREAVVEIVIDWTSHDAGHRDRMVFPRVNFWRDLFPGTLAEAVQEAGQGHATQTFAPGELVAGCASSNIHRIQRNLFGRHREQHPKIIPRTGRFYPRDFAAGTAGVTRGDMRPMRILDATDEALTIDLNHPLCDTPMAVTARIVEDLGTRAEHGGRCNDLVMDVLAGGVGLQAALANTATDFFTGTPFDRMDDREDGEFYSGPRLVQHLDSTAIAQVTSTYRRLLNPGMSILDLMSSWVSHLPEDLDDLAVTGLGLNGEELERNPRLAERLVKDINLDPTLPFPDRHFDAVVCTVSVEYLTRPIEVFGEIARVCRSGAPVIMTFSDRWFPTKAISLWSELHPFERVGLVLAYFRHTASFTGLNSESIRGLPRPADDPHADQRSTSDPVFAVWGTRI